MLTYRSFISAFRQLEIDPSRPVIVHASLSAFGEIQGGADVVLGALLATFGQVMMPAFTFKTMLIPEAGPPDNALVYGRGKDVNRMAEYFSVDMPADKMMGRLPEALRRNVGAHRSAHPILSFVGVGLDEALAAQSISEPLGPIHLLHADRAYVLLLGVDHTCNTSVHYAERIAGRKQFVRWALTADGVLECPGFPGCSDGFGKLDAHLGVVSHQVSVGAGLMRAVPLRDLVQAVTGILTADPLDLLCLRPKCERCNAVRAGSRLVS